jgi:hypothetical protein
MTVDRAALQDAIKKAAVPMLPGTSSQCANANLLVTASYECRSFGRLAKIRRHPGRSSP